jgi:hypothetical protein
MDNFMDKLFMDKKAASCIFLSWIKRLHPAYFITKRAASCTV